MSIRRLKTLIAVAETGTFAAAAEAVFISQAAVSMQMKALEAEFGVELFDRSKRPLALNRAGHALVPKAREVLRVYEGLAQSAAGAGELAGELTLGAIPTTLAGLVPKAVAALRGGYPDLRLRVVPGLSAELMAQVDRGHLDAAIISEPHHAQPQMQWQRFAAEPLIVLAPLEAEEGDAKTLLEAHPFIRFNRRAWVGRQIDGWLQQRQVRVRELMELDTLESISTMVYHGLGVSIVPQRCVPSPAPLPLKRVPLPAPAPQRLLGLLSRLDTPKARLTEVLLQALAALARGRDMGEGFKKS